MNNKLAPGVMVVCVYIADKQGDHDFLLGKVGTITEAITGPFALITDAAWIVDFPATKDFICPNCGRKHGSSWPMRSNEIKPINDPDQETETPTSIDEELPEEITA